VNRARRRNHVLGDVVIVETGHNARTCQGLILSSNHDDLYNSN
jgi:hypothetical protein